ncbi:uncharacterized [Tachysurus ichikawai]
MLIKKSMKSDLPVQVETNTTWPARLPRERPICLSRPLSHSGKNKPQQCENMAWEKQQIWGRCGAPLPTGLKIRKHESSILHLSELSAPKFPVQFLFTEPLQEQETEALGAAVHTPKSKPS